MAPRRSPAAIRRAFSASRRSGAARLLLRNAPNAAARMMFATMAKSTSLSNVRPCAPAFASCAWTSSLSFAVMRIAGGLVWVARNFLASSSLPGVDELEVGRPRCRVIREVAREVVDQGRLAPAVG
jgi:hypothetical protein